MKRAAAHSVLHYVTWLVVGQLIEAVFAENQARGAYGLLSAWWATLYVGYLAGIGLAAIPGLCLVVLLGFAAAINPLTLSRADSPVLSFGGTVMVLSQVLGLVSPILVNGVVRMIVRTVGRRSAVSR